MNGKSLSEYLADVTTNAQGCALWTGPLDRDGYAKFSGRGAHRVVFERFHGPISGEMTVDHICFNRHCVNVAHLRLLTNRQNCRNTKERPGLVDETRCIGGHALTEENAYYTPSGSRDCRICIRARVAAYRARKKAAA